MSDLFFWLTVYGKGIYAAIFIDVLLWIIVFILGLTFFGSLFSFYDVVDNEKYKKELSKTIQRVRKPFIILSIFLFLIQVSIIVAPTKKEILTFCVLKQVDSYNDENETSNFNPENIIKSADDTITKITNMVDKLLVKLDKKEKE